MLTIKNIDKVIGMMCFGRDIYHISNHRNTIGEESYVFEFDAIEDGQFPNGFNKPQEIHLMRDADADGCYKVFVMGLQLATEDRVTDYNIKDKHGLLVTMSCCLSAAKTWWSLNNK